MTVLSEMKEKHDGFTLVCFNLWLFFASAACLVCPDRTTLLEKHIIYIVKNLNSWKLQLSCAGSLCSLV